MTASSLVLVSIITVDAGAAVKTKTQPLLKPAWSNGEVLQQEANLSFLSDVQAREEAELTSDDLIDPKKSQELRTEYDVVSRQFELQRNFQSGAGTPEREEYRWASAFSMKAIGEIRNTQLRKFRQFHKLFLGDFFLKGPLSVALAIAAAGTGAPFKGELAPDARVTAFANLPHQTTYVELGSPWLNGSFSYYGGPHATLGSWAAGPPDYISRSERYRFSLSRTLPVWNLGSDVVYGGSSNTVTASVSKRITPHLSAAVASRHPVDSSSTISKAEETVRMEYKVSF